MEELRVGQISTVIGYLVTLLRKCLFYILSKGPIPSHLAFIMDGNRRYAKKEKLDMKIAYRAGFSALLYMLKYCCELGVKNITFYAFSIDNFKRRPDEVQILMDLLMEKAHGLMQQKSIVDEYGIRVMFVGNLKLLSKDVQKAVENVAKATENNTKCMLFICICYTSTDEIRHAVEEYCVDKSNHIENPSPEKLDDRNTKVGDVEKRMYTSVAPDPDVLIRTSGETRLSNFLTWQTGCCLLYSPETLWPEIGLWDLAWATLTYQQCLYYLDKQKKLC